LPVLEPVKIKPAVNEMEDFYVKGPDDKKCPKGYIQDKKDKTKCIRKLVADKLVDKPAVKLVTDKPVAKPVADKLVADKPAVKLVNKPAAKLVTDKPVAMNVAVAPLVVPPVAAAVAKSNSPIVNEIKDFYIKEPNEKKCQTGFSQDKKDKTKCVRKTAAKTKKASPVKKASPQSRKASPQSRKASPQSRKASPQSRKASPQSRKASPQSRKASPIMVAPAAAVVRLNSPIMNENNDIYIKRPNDKKCPKGFSQDKKDKTKCLRKTVAAKTKKASPVIREITPPPQKAPVKVFSPHSPSYSPPKASPPKAPVPLPPKAKPIVKEKEKVEKQNDSPQKTRKNKKIPDHQEPNRNKILTTTDKIRNKCNSLKELIKDELN
jgi:hypothetical protein